MRKWLIFDADDTLWENNLYFGRAIEEFLDLLRFIIPDHRQVRSLINEIEQESIPQRGYGSLNFIRALEETFQRLYRGKDGVVYLEAIGQIGERLLNHPIELLPGVAPTLQILRSRYRMLLFTKGDFREQSDKLDRSGLSGYFEQVEIAREKDVEAYQELILRHALPGESTCMVGNSPRSDVVPALAAGLWAVFIPHPQTWELERQEVPPHPRLLSAQSIQELPSLLSAMDDPRL